MAGHIVILAGDAYVGKTNLVYRFVKTGSENSKNIAPTVGVEFSSKMVRLQDGRRIKAQIWDTGTPPPIQPAKSNTVPSQQRTPTRIKPLPQGPGRFGGLRHNKILEFRKRQKMDRRNPRARLSLCGDRHCWKQARPEKEFRAGGDDY